MASAFLSVVADDTSMVDKSLNEGFIQRGRGKMAAWVVQHVMILNVTKSQHFILDKPPPYLTIPKRARSYCSSATGSLLKGPWGSSELLIQPITPDLRNGY